MSRYKNIIFDLGGVVVERDPSKCTREFIEFFDYIHYDPMPSFWSDYDRGVVSFEGVKSALAKYRGVTQDFCDEYVERTIYMQEEVPATKSLIERLKSEGYRLYVLSNMASEYIEYIRTLPVYKNFDGEVISSEEGVVKPEESIYKILLDRYNLDPAESLFVDDRKANVDVAESLGIDSVLFVSRSSQSSCAEVLERVLS